MENTSNSIVYAVNSDLDDGLLYAEFEDKDAAIDYAKQHLDKLPFVDELEVSYDANGEIEDVFNYKTVWDHTMADQEAEAAVADATDTEDAYWDFRGNQEGEAEKDKHDIGDTTWFESMDNLVEEMEENEDLVECKECFDLFPKADCIKLEIGYVCPNCDGGHEVTDEDTFKVDFPEYEKFNYENDMVSEEPISEVEPSEEVPASEPVGPEGEPGLTPEEAVPFLVNDEVEAVAGYDQAAEVVADSDLENKEEILDTIEHIKEEEEEHIEELQDLVDTEDDEIIEVENDPISDEAEVVEDTEEELVEHINDRAEPIESDQELEGTDNAVVDCKVADVVAHSEDEKPVDCEGKKEPLEKPLTEGFIFSLTNEKDLTEFTQLCQEVGLKTIGDLDRFTKETAGEPGNILDKLRAYRKELGDEFQIKESLYNFTEEEMTEYNMDEDGVSLDSYDEYVRCNWCGEVYTVDSCEFEANLGWLCDRCYSAIRSRGEKLTIIKNPTDEDIAKTLTEAKKMTRDEVMDKEGTDDVELINAGRSEEDCVEIVD